MIFKKRYRREREDKKRREGGRNELIESIVEFVSPVEWCSNITNRTESGQCPLGKGKEATCGTKQ